MIREDYNIERFETDTKLETIRTKYINFHKTEKLCKNCRCYDNNWTCPPFHNHPTQIWDKYENIKLILLKFNFTKEAKQKQYNSETIMNYAFDLHHTEKTLIEPELQKLEKQLNGYYLTCGPCVNCKICQKLSDKQCIMPEKQKYAMESLGADIISITRDYFNLEMRWIKEN